MIRKLKPNLLVVSAPHLVFLFLWLNFIRNVKSFGCNTRQKVEQKATQYLFINNRRSSCTSLKASKILSLIPPPLLPPSPPPSLFDVFQDTLNTFVGDVRQIQLDFDTSHVVNLKDQASNLLPKILEMIKNISSSVREHVSPFGHSNMDFSMPDISLDIHSLAMLFQGFEFDSSLKTIGVVSKLQSEILQSYPQLNMFIQLSTDIFSTVSPAYTFFASTIISYALVNAALSQHASSPSHPYPMNKYDALTARAYFDRRPLLATLRGLTVGSRSLQFGLSLVLDQLQEKVDDNEMQRGRELAVLLTRLGPTFIKIGQSLSIRTDLLRPAYIRGLETLQDQVPAFDTKVAKRILEAEWGKPITTVLSDDLSAKPVAAASLGQVYKARLRDSNEEVAIKVQRPDIVEQIALDMYLIRTIGGIVRRLAKLNTDIVGTVDAWGIGFIDELDYIQEAENGEKFSELILETPLRDVVFAPTVLREFTTRSVLVSSWVNGERLDRSISRDVSLICSIAMNTYLTMLLEFGLLRTLKPTHLTVSILGYLTYFAFLNITQ
jgi:ABC1 atypical kinase-like domain